MLLGAAVLLAAAWLRGPEYDEQYTLFLTAGNARPAWPSGPFPAAAVAAAQAGHAGLASIAQDLRATDVHPPLYFWAVSLWRWAFGPGLFTARLFSVLCATVSLCLVAALARRHGAAPARAVLLTAACYGFAYTGAIARGFAPAETLLLAGALLLPARPVLAGAAFGLACDCNYLAVFVATALCAHARAWRAAIGAAPFLALAAWFFAAQHGARDGQFPPFDLWHAIVRLAGYQAAAIFGGLPLYVDGPARIAVSLAIAVIAVTIPLGAMRASRTIWLAAAASPIGLLLLGAAFDNTPIELRYLSFGLPFIALLAARGRFRSLVLTVQAAGIAGLLLAPLTMQPARRAAAAAAPFTDAIALVPYGNDGVGIPGAFGIEAPPDLPLLLIRPGEAPVIPPQFQRALLITLSQDRDSTAAIPAMRKAVEGWRQIASEPNLEAYERP